MLDETCSSHRNSSGQENKRDKESSPRFSVVSMLALPQPVGQSKSYGPMEEVHPIHSKKTLMCYTAKAIDTEKNEELD